jgi:hypothetical protein
LKVFISGVFGPTLNKHPDYQNLPVSYEVDYSVYLQRGRQEQARAMRQMVSGLSRWLKRTAVHSGQSVKHLLSGSARREHNLQY